MGWDEVGGERRARRVLQCVAASAEDDEEHEDDDEDAPAVHGAGFYRIGCVAGRGEGV